jgi:ribosomal protein S18 acetylase RimI-like enzyme
MNIRLEQPKDYREVENLTREAFWNVYAPGCVEHFVLHQYRNNPDFIPELDFVMEEDGKIIGSVRAYAKNGTAYIGKLMVHPDHRCKGYGTLLLNEIEKCFPDCRFELFTSTRSEDNIRLYKKLGYMIFDTKKITDELVFVYLEKQ